MHAHQQLNEAVENGSSRSVGRPRRPAAGPSPAAGATAAGLLHLQRAAGNAAVARVLEQERHTHGAGCGHEEPQPQAARQAPAQQPAVQPSAVRQFEVQRSAVHAVLRSAGRPLDDALREEMEARFGGGQRFGDVRVHTGTEADRSAAEIGAQAYTSGRHVVLGKEAVGDKRVIAHELTHVVQQSRGPVPGTDNGAGLSVSDPGDHQEIAAEANAVRVMSGQPPMAAGEMAPAGPGEAQVPAGAAPVQGMWRSTRDSTRDQRDRDRRDPSGRTRGSAAGGGDSAERRARRVPPPTRGPGGEPLWDGTRRQLGFTSAAVREVLADTPREWSESVGAYRYECRHCAAMVFDRATAERHPRRSEDSQGRVRWYEIDHMEGIIANVNRSVDPVQWIVPVGEEGFLRRAEAVYLDDARDAANDPDNLQVLCNRCNGGRRAHNSESRHMDTSGARWVGAPYV